MIYQTDDDNMFHVKSELTPSSILSEENEEKSN